MAKKTLSSVTVTTEDYFTVTTITRHSRRPRIQSPKQIAAVRYGQRLGALRMLQVQATRLKYLEVISDTNYNQLIEYTSGLIRLEKKAFKQKLRKEYEVLE